jgi:DNA mismatch repair protein MutL
MPKIYKLSAHEAQKIAAGEVVERPANVVKELIENAIDAHATQITLYLEDGGKQLIRVIDNGCGMSAEDATLSFEHHATSKLKTIDDLSSISTFGFRGEALSSIASVSKTTLITKEAHSEHAYKIHIQQSTIIEEGIASANTGTDMSVQEIFFNVPARKKFLKSAETESRQIQQLFQAFCLDYLNIHFKMFSDGRQVLNCPATADVHQRTMQLWDHNFASHIIPLQEHNKDGIKISGVISNHHFARYDRSAIFFFVNKRWVKHQKLSSALLKGYLNVIQPARYPAAAIFIEVDPEHVDVNIHPRKEEVQFLHPRKVETALQQAVKDSLENHLSAQLKRKITFAPATEVHTISPNAYSGLQFESRYTPQGMPVATPRTPVIFENKDDLEQPFESMQEEPLSIPLTHIPSASFQQQIETQIETPPFLYTQENNYTLIGQHAKTYLLLEKEEGLYIVDQHAAHERVLYELFSKRFEEIATVKLMFPQLITLTSASIKMLEPFIDLFNHNGIDLQIFSETELVVQSTPVHLKNQSLQELVTDVLSWIAENQSAEQAQFFKAINERIHAQMACKAAVKAGDILTREQMEQLLDDLNKSDNRFTCPHGRPTGWLLSTHEIEKKFKRKL